jgi:hypothetical protein
MAATTRITTNNSRRESQRKGLAIYSLIELESAAQIYATEVAILRASLLKS